MPHKFDGKKIFVITISVAILIGTFVVGSQVVQQSLAQASSQMGQDVERNETGNQTANQSAGIGDPAILILGDLTQSTGIIQTSL